MFFRKMPDKKDLTPEQRQQKNHLSYILESYKSIRANIMFAMAGNKSDDAHIIMFSGAEQAVGKTTTCINVAQAFAEASANVLVIDADLRRPSVERYITEKKEKQGLSEFIGGFCELDDVIVRPEDCGFDCIFSGRTPPNPSELLMLDKVQDMLKTLSERYDYIFIDVPPVNIVSETLYLTQFVDGVLLVAKTYSTHYNKLQSAIAGLKFANANFLGFVLNGALNRQKRKYYKRGRYYYY